MYTVTSMSYPACSAHITTNRNRAKNYGNSIYLKNGQNFEIELFNPTQSKALAKISINGKLISNAGIVLRPGERVYLERFLDSRNKFVFETYEVENSKQTMDAIANNGLVEISFYSESFNNYSYFGNTGTNIFNRYTVPYTIHTRYNTNTVEIPGTVGNSGITGSTITTTSSGSYYTNMYSLDMSMKKSAPNMISQSIETGSVEKGGHSNQNFHQVSENFDSFPSTSVTYKIMPESQKPVEISNLRNYCTGCGTRIKKPTWKFCPNCGTKF